MLQVITWEKKLLKIEETEESWTLYDQVVVFVGGSKAFATRLCEAAKAAGRVREHPVLNDELQFKIVTKDLEVSGCTHESLTVPVM